MVTLKDTGKSPLWMRITLFASLALNLLVIGSIAGLLVLGEPGKRPDRDSREVGAIYMRALEPEDRRALRRDFVRKLSRDERGGRERIFEDMKTVVDALRATPFDPDAFSAALADQSDRRRQREQIGRDALAARVAALSDAERAAYADRVEAELRALEQRKRK